MIGEAGGRMKLSILGLGYVGCVSAACFAKRGHEVVGADVSPVKVDIINAGKSPIVEPGIDELISEAVAKGSLRATTDAAEAVMQTDVSLVCVGTPGQHNGSLDLTYVKRVCQQIGAAIEKKSARHVVAMRSTMLPGTIQDVVIPTLQVYSGKQAGKDFGVVINPEFLREGTAPYDVDHPPLNTIGAAKEETAERESAATTSWNMTAAGVLPGAWAAEAARAVKMECARRLEPEMNCEPSMMAVTSAKERW